MVRYQNILKERQFSAWQVDTHMVLLLQTKCICFKLGAQV